MFFYKKGKKSSADVDKKEKKSKSGKAFCKPNYNMYHCSSLCRDL